MVDMSATLASFQGALDQGLISPNEENGMKTYSCFRILRVANSE